MLNKKKDDPKTANQKIQDKYKALLGKMSRGTQNYAVLNHLLTCGSISSMEAFSSYGITRLSARIANLKDLGVDITCEIVRKNKSNYGVYRLGEE